MKTKNYAALLAILAISAFLHADSYNIPVTPDYSTHQIALFKQLIKKHPSLLQNTTIKSWAAYLKCLSHQQARTTHKPQKILASHTHARLSELYNTALKLKYSLALHYKNHKHSTSDFSATFPTVPKPVLAPDNQEQKQAPTLYSDVYSWHTFPIVSPPSCEFVTFSAQNQISDKNRAFRDFVNELRAHHHASRSRYYDDDYKIISI